MEKKEKVIILNERQQNELADQIHNNKDKRKLNWFYGVKKCKIAMARTSDTCKVLDRGRIVTERRWRHFMLGIMTSIRIKSFSTTIMLLLLLRIML